MTTTLLTFLGRVPKTESGYRKTSYDFGDGSRSEPVAFFGWPLQKRIAAQRLVIMGTAGSMWNGAIRFISTSVMDCVIFP